MQAGSAATAVWIRATAFAKYINKYIFKKINNNKNLCNSNGSHNSGVSCRRKAVFQRETGWLDGTEEENFADVEVEPLTTEADDAVMRRQTGHWSLCRSHESYCHSLYIIQVLVFVLMDTCLITLIL